MNLSLKGFSQIVQDMSACLQSSASILVDVSVGSVMRALFEANASVVLWMQWLIMQVLQTTRASTSVGMDLDSWMADFGLSRMSATPSTGTVIFSRFAANFVATIPVGTTVKTSDGLLSFTVTENNAISTWQSAVGAYVIPSGVVSAGLPVVCATGGSVGNILASTISIIAASLPGIDQVSNAQAFSNGIDAETDQAFRIRFQGYLASLSRATLGSVQNAIVNVRQGLNFAIRESTGAGGAPQVGAFLILIDDGTGYPSVDLLASVASAVEAVRPIGTVFSVVPPMVLTVNVSLVVVFSPSSNVNLVTQSIQSCVAGYLNSILIGGSASITRVAQNAYLGGQGILNISNVLLNGGLYDITTSPGVVVKAGQIVVLANAG